MGKCSREHSKKQLHKMMHHRRRDHGRKLSLTVMQARTTPALGRMVAMRTVGRGVRVGLRRHVHCRMIGHLRHGELHARCGFRRTALRRCTRCPLSHQQQPRDYPTQRRKASSTRSTVGPKCLHTLKCYFTSIIIKRPLPPCVSTLLFAV